MKKDIDTIKVSSESKLQLPLANLIGIIIVVSGAVFGYANLTSRISSLETADTLFAADLLKKAEQEPKNLEMYMLSSCLKGKRVANRTASSNIEYRCIKSKAELETNIDGSQSIKKLILE